MKSSLTILFLILFTGNTFANNREGSRNRTQTLYANQLISDEEIDRVGAVITNRESGEALFANCEVRNANGKCDLINYVLQNNNQNYLVYECKDKDCRINVNLKIMGHEKTRKRLKSNQRYRYYTEDCKRDKINFGSDFLQYTNGSLLLFPVGLIVLPFALIVDVAFLPAMTINALNSIKYVRGHQDLIFGEDETIETSPKKFNTFLDSLVSYRNNSP